MTVQFAREPAIGAIANRKKHWPSNRPTNKTLAAAIAGFAGIIPTASVEKAPLAICIKP